MRFLFRLTVVISGIVSIVGFTLTAMATTSFDPTGDNFVGENGTYSNFNAKIDGKYFDILHLYT